MPTHSISRDSHTETLTRRYYQLLNETLAAHNPVIQALLVPDPCTTLSFSLAVRDLQKIHDLRDLGLAYGSRISISDYGIVGLAIASTRSFGEALATQMRFLKMLTDVSKVSYTISDSNGLTTIALTELIQSGETNQFMMGAELSAQVRFIADLLPDAQLAQCHLYIPFACPRTRHFYESLLGCKVSFDESEARLTFPSQWMDAVLKTSDVMLAPLLKDRCEHILARMQTGDDWTLRVRNHVLTEGSFMQSLAVTAAALDLPVHTLRARLYKSGTNYKKVILEVRMQLACQYLEETHLTLQQISYQLGYSQPSNFQLAFRKYFHKAPGEWRANASKRVKNS